MGKQIIFCMEAKRQAATDWVYINETIKRFYIESNKIHLEKEFLDGKNNYNSKGIMKSIKKKTNEFKQGETFVIYCIDVDNFENNPTHIKDFVDIDSFCQQNGFDIVWFCHDIEDVYLGKRIPKDEKVKEAERFRKNKGIYLIDEVKLTSSNNHKIHSSNILKVLDEHFDRQKRQ